MSVARFCLNHSTESSAPSAGHCSVPGLEKKLKVVTHDAGGSVSFPGFAFHNPRKTC